VLAAALGVELADFAGDALADHPRVLVDQDAHWDFVLGNDVCRGLISCYSSASLFEQPIQRLPFLSSSASIDNVKHEEQVPITNVPEERVEAVWVALALLLGLAPQCERLVMPLNHRK